MTDIDRPNSESVGGGSVGGGVVGLGSVNSGLDALRCSMEGEGVLEISRPGVDGAVSRSCRLWMKLERNPDIRLLLLDWIANFRRE